MVQECQKLSIMWFREEALNGRDYVLAEALVRVAQL
jgi:hypothetical protein